MDYNVTLRSFLKDQRNRNLVLTAGADGIDNIVTKVTVLDAPDGPSWLKGGEFILTSTFLFNNDPERLCTFCEQLIAVNASGFGLKMGRYLTTVPQKLIKLCDSHSFPLVIIPYSLVWTDIISVFYEHYYNLNQEEKYSTVKSKIVDQIRRSSFQGLQWIGERIYSFFETPVLFLNQKFQVLETMGLESEKEALEKSVEDFKKERPDRRKIIKQIQGKYYLFCQCRLLQYGVYYMILSSESSNILKELKEILVDAHILVEEKILMVPEKNLIEQTLPMLVSGNVSTLLIDKLEMCIEKSGGCYCLIYINGCSSNETTKEAKNIIRQLKMDVQAYDLFNTTKKLCLLLLRFPKAERDYEVTMKIRDLTNRMESFLLDENYQEESIYVSNIYYSYKNFEQSYDEVKLTERYVRCIWGQRRLCYFEDIFPYYLMMNSGVLATYLDGIEKLKDEEEDFSFDYLKTLETWLRHGNFKQAAEELYIHENTLRYRIKKIGKILHVDFDDAVTMQNYIMKMNYWKLSRGLYSD